MTMPVRVMAVRLRVLRTCSPGERGGRCITLRCGGSMPRAMAGGPSMMMLTQSSWIADMGAGGPASTVASSVRMAPIDGHPGRLGERDCVACLGTRWIGDARDRGECQPGRLIRMAAVAHGGGGAEDTQTLAAHAPRDVGDLAAALRCEGTGPWSVNRWVHRSIRTSTAPLACTRTDSSHPGWKVTMYFAAGSKGISPVRGVRARRPGRDRPWGRGRAEGGLGGVVDDAVGAEPGVIAQANGRTASRRFGPGRPSAVRTVPAVS